MYREDIEGSMAHAAMLSRQGIITEEDGRQIRLGLRSILKDMDAGVISLTPEQYEDIHMANEQLLTERIGEAGKRLHTARSRNDQVALDLRLYVRREIGEIGGADHRAFGGAVHPGGGECGDGDARLHPPPEGAAHHLRPPPHGLREHVPPGCKAPGELSGGDG